MSNPRFFKKFNARQGLYLSNGKQLKFTQVDNDHGVIGLTEPSIIAEIEACIRAGRGGVTEITGEEYQEAKKKALETPSVLAPRKREELLKGANRPIPTRQASPAPVAAAATVPEVAVGDVNAIRPKASR